MWLMNIDLKRKLVKMVMDRVHEITWRKASLMNLVGGIGRLDEHDVIITPVGISFDDITLGFVDDIPEVATIWEHAERQFLAESIEALGGVGAPNEDLN